MIRRRWRGGWLLALVLVLAACAGPGGPDPAATATRGAELAHLTQVAGTTEAIVRNVATPRAPTPTPTFGPPSSIPARPGTATIAPTPQGGPNAPTITAIPLVANDLIYDPRSQRIYATIPGRAGAQGNSLVAIDPFTGAIGTPIPIGSEPSRLALSDDGRYLYAVLGGTEAVRRYDIARGVVDLDISLDSDPARGICFASDIEVVPGQATLLAVAYACRSGNNNTDSRLIAYNGATKLPGLPAPHGPNGPGGDIVFCGADPLLYRYAGNQHFRVSTTGVTVAGTRASILSYRGNVHELRCVGDRLYGSGGEVIDTRTGAFAGKYAGLDSPALVHPDATSGRTFFLDLVSHQVPRLYVYDQTRFTLLATAYLPNLPRPENSPNRPVGRLVRWGDDGLAFLSGEQLILLRSPLVDGRAPIPATAPLPTPTTGRAPLPSAQPTSPPPATSSTKVALVTNDIIYDPKTQRLYASVPGSAGPNGNSIVPIDPATGALGPPIFVGSEPSALALSNDGNWLYVGLAGAGAIQRIDLATQRADTQFALGGSSNDGPYIPGDIAVIPGHPDTIAVVLLGQSNNPAGVALFVDGVKKPTMPGHTARSINEIEACDSPAALYGFESISSGAEFYWLTVGTDGITAASSRREQFAAYGRIACDNGRIYASSGEVLDPETRRQVGQCPAGGLIRPDSTLGRVFYLTITENKSAVVAVCDQRSFALLGRFQVPTFERGNRHSGFVRWGADGLAYRGGPGELFIVRSPLVSGQP